MKEYSSVNPFNNNRLESFKTDSLKTCIETVECSGNVQKHWKTVPAHSKTDMLEKLSSLLLNSKNDLAETASQEMGKPIREAIAEVEKCAWVCRFYAEKSEEWLAPQQVDTSPNRAEVRRQALGIILAIMPWNFPYWQVFRVLAPNLMAGNAIIIKHAPNVTRCALKIQSIVERAGFPKDLVCVIKPNLEDIEAIIAHPDIHGVTLTGSTQAGRSVAAIAGKNIKKTVLELGGSNAFIVCQDADLSKVIPQAITGRFMNNGQSCIAAKRFIVHSSLYQEFKRRILNEVDQLIVGDPLDPNTDIGPLARVDLADELMSQVQSSIKTKKCVPCTDIRQASATVYPIVLECEDTNCRAWKEETFGPLLVMTTFESEEDALSLASDTEYGLGLSIFTNDPARFAERMQNFHDGAVFFNSFVKSDPRLPFGGTRNSGYGRELGREGLLEFTQAQTVFWEADHSDE